MDREAGDPSAEPGERRRLSHASITRDAELTGRTLGDFVVGDKLGEGGFGVVYRAHQPLLDRPAVIKVLHTRLRATGAATERFLREARLASRLDHPFAAHIYAFGAETDGTLWIAMELVRGTTLAEYLRAHGPFGVERFVPLLERICEVVHSAHEQGIIHRDLKPANVMVMARAGRLLPKLLDFGIAKSLLDASAESEDEPSAAKRDAVLSREARLGTDDTIEPEADATVLGPRSASASPREVAIASKLTQRGAVMGSPHYMAPEQWDDATNVTARTDLYALGILAYEALTGAPPFRASSVSLLASAHVADKVPPLPAHLPAALNDAFTRALAKRPEDRFDNALEMAVAFRAAAGLSAERKPLPQLDDALRLRYVADGPQPIAESIAALEAARDPRQARDALWSIPGVLAQWLAVVALAARSRLGPSHDGSQTLAMVREVATGVPAEDDWIEAAYALVRGYADKADLHPVPELVLFACGPGDEPGEGLRLYRDLVALRPTTAEATASDDEVVARLGPALVLLTALLRRAELVCNYNVVVPTSDGYAERWSGARRSPRTQVLARGSVVANSVLLVDREGAPLVALHPLVQVAEPAPGVARELFVFAGRDRRGAKLAAPPSTFELHDAQILDWLRMQMASTLDPDHADGLGERPPYRGLSAFTAEDAALYVGREQAVDAFVNRLRIEPLIAVVGPSGAGKSSFVQAGVIPALGAEWRAVVVRPGPAPLAALASRLAAVGIHATELSVRLRGDPARLGDLLRDDASARGPIVLVVDQLEELFTVAHDDSERQAFASAIASAARTADDRVRVILTVRDDFLVRAQELLDLRDRFARGLQLLTAPSRDDLQRMLVEPARRVGYEFEDPALPATMVAEVAERPGALALLSFTAAQLWEHRDRHFRRLPTKAYEMLGGVGGALAGHAETMLAAAPASEQRLIREAFRHLVTAEGTRAVLTRGELVTVMGDPLVAGNVIERLVASRLLVACEGETEEQIEIAHEALISAWPRLVEWQREDREGARLRDQLRAAARQWEARGRPRGLLWRDDALGELTRWRTRHATPLTEIETAFADSSVRDAARGRRARRIAIAAVVGVLAVAVIILAQLRSRAQDLQRNAELKVIAQLEEQGRQAVVAGDSLRAAVYLSSAYSAGVDTPALRYMLARSLVSPSAERVRFEGHKGPIQWLDVSPDGRTLLTVSDDGSARLWDLETGELRRAVDTGASLWKGRFDATGRRFVTAGNDGVARIYSTAGQLLASTGKHAALVFDARFDAAGERIATAAYDGTAGVWNATTGTRIASLETGGWATESATWISDQVLLTCNNDGTIRLWSADGSVRVREINAGNTFACDTSPDGSIVASGGEGRTLSLWDARTGRLLRALAGHSGAIQDFQFDPTGALIASADEQGVVLVWRVADGTLVSALVGNSSALTRVRFDGRGETLVTASRDGTVRHWNVATGLQLGVFEGHAAVVTTVAFLYTGSIVTCAHDGMARRWDLQRSRVKALVVDDQQIGAVRYSPSGSEILTSGGIGASGQTTVRIWNARDGRRIASLRKGVAEFDARGERVVVGSPDGMLTIWDAKTGVFQGSLPEHAAALRAVAFSPDGRLVASAGDDAGQIVDARGETPPVRLPEANLTAITFRPDGAHLLTTSRDKTAQIWDRAGHRVARLAGHDDEVIGGAFNPDGRTVVTASRDATARLWDAVSGRELAVLRGHSGALTSVRFDHGGRTIVTTSQDLTGKLWDARDGRLLGTLSRHDVVPFNAAFSPDDRFVATAGDRTVAIWDVATARMVDRLRGHNSLVWDVAWSAAGDRVLSASEDRTIAAWSVSFEQRSPHEVAAWVRCHVPFVLQDEALVEARPVCRHDSSN